jgi:hypothetical protein
VKSHGHFFLFFTLYLTSLLAHNFSFILKNGGGGGHKVKIWKPKSQLENNRASQKSPIMLTPAAPTSHPACGSASSRAGEERAHIDIISLLSTSAPDVQRRERVEVDQQRGKHLGRRLRTHTHMMLKATLLSRPTAVDPNALPRS